MSTTLTTIRDRVKENWPAEFHATELTNAVITRYLNSVQRELCRAHNFAFMKQEVTRLTVDETQKYTLPTAGDANWTEVLTGATVLRFKRDISLELINSQSYRVPLIKLHKQLLEDKKVLAKETGKGIPQYYDVDQKRIWLYKIPDHDYNDNTAWTMNFEFYGFLADVADDSSDNNELTNNHPLILEYGATARGFAFAQDWVAYAKWLNLAQEIFLIMLEEDTELQLSGQEEGFFPDPAQAVGGGDPYKGFLQGTDWYTS